MYKSFKAIDKNSDGKISKEELIEGYKKIYKHMSEEDVVREAEKLFAIADADGSGEIDYSEWQVATINKYNVLSEEKMRNAFKVFDKVSNPNFTCFNILISLLLISYTQQYRMEVDLFRQMKLKKFLEEVGNSETKVFGRT